MSTTDATVAALWRYPVKSMLGEHLDSAAIGDRGVAGDRAYALIDVETGNVVSAKNPRKWARLFECRAEYLEPPEPGREAPPVRITLPDGAVVRSDDPGVDAALTNAARSVGTSGERGARCTHDRGPRPRHRGHRRRRPGHGEPGQIALLAGGTFFDAAPGTRRDHVEPRGAGRGEPGLAVRPGALPAQPPDRNRRRRFRRERMGRSQPRGRPTRSRFTS